MDSATSTEGFLVLHIRIPQTKNSMIIETWAFRNACLKSSIFISKSTTAVDEAPPLSPALSDPCSNVFINVTFTVQPPTSSSTIIKPSVNDITRNIYTINLLDTVTLGVAYRERQSFSSRCIYRVTRFDAVGDRLSASYHRLLLLTSQVTA